ncbi:MAG: cytochrome c oxidase accessory protein CcoG, partial [Marinosulfonomonas sp.]|nr:cytochrome c oxidase accessory protein CcoG [Marinosulfonomonas sp.]
MSISPIRNPTFVTLSDGTIRNTYDVRLRNKHGDDRLFDISVAGGTGLAISLEGLENGSVMVPANETLLQRVYITAPKGSAPATLDRTEFRMLVEDKLGDEQIHTDTVFNGKGN